MSDTEGMDEQGRRQALLADVKARYTPDPLGRVLASMEYAHRVWGDGGRLPTTVAERVLEPRQLAALGLRDGDTRGA